MKKTRIYLFLLAVSLCLPTTGFAQSNAKPDFKHAHKNAEKYQKHLMKQQRKQERAQAKSEAKAVKASKHHQ